MYLSKVKINGYRGINKMDDFLDIGNLTAFVGRNDVGKSTIINALAVFFNDSSLKALSGSDFNYNSTENKIEIECVFAEPTHKLREYWTETKKKEDGIDEQIEYYKTDDVLQIKLVADKETKKASYWVWVEDYKNEDYKNLYSLTDAKINQLVKKLSVEIPKEGTGNNSKAEKIKYIREKLDQQREVKDKTWIDDKDIKKALPFFEIFKADYSLEIKDNFDKKFNSEVKAVLDKEENTNNLNKIEEDINTNLALEAQEIKVFLKEYVPDIEELEIKVKAQWMNAVQTVDVNLKTKGENEKVPIAQKGTGYRRLLMVAQLRYLAKKGNKTNTIYAIEEPETYLHPKAQDELLEALKIISDQNQIIITTHSPIFAGNVEKDFTVLVKKDDQQKSSVYYQNGSDHRLISEIIHELGIEPSHELISQAKFLLFVEGKDDLMFIQKAQERLNFNLDLTFCLGGGSSLKNVAELDLFNQIASSPNRYCVIIDSDKGSSDEKAKNKNAQEIENRCKNDNALFFKLTKREIENYCNSTAIIRTIKKEIFALKDLIDTVVLEIKNDTDVEKHIQEKIPTLKGSFKNGLNIKVFEEMTEQEWQEVSQGELEGIFEKIKENF
jgi:putative ATP-dependent endonuclease of OLD family